MAFHEYVPRRVGDTAIVTPILVTVLETSKPKQPLQPPETLLGPSPMQTIDHWLRRCFRLDATRQYIFGSPSAALNEQTHSRYL